MASEMEVAIVKKATVYDIIDMIESNKGKQTYTPEEIKALLKAYVKGTEQS